MKFHLRYAEIFDVEVTLPLFCFPEHNRCILVKWNIFNMQDNFTLLASNVISCKGSWTTDCKCVP